MSALNLTYANSDRSSASLFEPAGPLLRPKVDKIRDFSPQGFLYGPIAPDWRVVQPLRVNFEQDEDETYVVSDDIFLVYGEGDSIREALEDYTVSLIELYQLVEEGARLNPLDQVQLRRLQFYLQADAQFRQ